MINRRNFFRIGAGTTIAAAAGGVAPAHARDGDAELKRGVGVSPWSGAEYKSVQTVCALCQSRCPMTAYLEDGRLAKLDGNGQSIRTGGRLCARGQAGLEQLYDPDRILSPMKRVGARGDGRWQTITWEAALDELAGRLKTLRSAGQAERFMVLHGWLSLGTERMLKEMFLPTFGSASVVGPESLGQSARRLAHQLTWGGAPDHWDLERSRFVLNFGSNFLEASTNHVALARRFSNNAVDNRARMVTFDVRLSNTAARSDEWAPIRPGTDLAVALAMCNVVMSEGLHKGEGDKFLEFCKITPSPNASLADKVAALKSHLEPYTPEWAEKISGVPASRIKAIATDFATTRPACVISHRGASAHSNGVETERAILMLAAITGNIDNPGGRCQGVLPRWVTPKVEAPPAKRLATMDGPAGTAALAIDGVIQHALRAAKPGDGPDVLMWIGHNPVYAHGDVNETVALLRDEKLLPFTVAVTPFYDESAALADLILPDTTPLEGYDIEAAVSANQVAEYAIRQPAIEPLREARDVKDVLGDLAQRLGFTLPVRTGAKLVEEACRATQEVRTKARGFAGMRRTGVWSDKDAQPRYQAYARSVPQEEFQRDGVILDEESGVYWNWKAAGVATAAEAGETGYLRTPNAARGYVGQKVGETTVAGFAPDRIAKSGLFEIYSERMKELGRPGLPAFDAIPEHKEMKPEQLVLVTYKVNVQTNSRTGNSRWLDEIHHDNPAWLNPVTAQARGIGHGDAITITSALGAMQTTAHVTHAVAPWVVAVSNHCGRTQYGRFASGKRAPGGVDDKRLDRGMWWTRRGTHVNGVIPKTIDPLSGQQRWMDTLVTVARSDNRKA